MKSSWMSIYHLKSKVGSIIAEKYDSYRLNKKSKEKELKSGKKLNLF